MTELTLSRITERAEIVPWSGCWIWTGDLNDRGYASAFLGGKRQNTHRWVYEQIHGPVPGLVVDHLCRVRCCINPAHLRAITNRENILAGIGFSAENAKRTHCIYGHPFNKLKKLKSGKYERQCSVCVSRSNREYKQRRKEKRRQSNEQR